MDTNQIKKFAIDARNKLKQGVEAKILKLGFSRRGEVEEGMAPELLQGGSIWNGQTMSESFYHQWMSLYNRVQQVGIKEVYEEAAYTWFNRLVAIRILRRNNLIEPVLEYVGQSRMPKIVDDARTGVHLPNMTDRQRERLRQLLDDDTKVTEQFALLIVAWCHDNPIINSCFGSIADYTELLLPDNILSEGGFMDDINHTDFITDEDYHSPELIGWLYQFYISERKDEVFAKKGKFEADEIAPATQIFTPNWIVKYMVQNTIGRIYLDNHPEAESVFKPKWEYLVDQPKTEPQNVCKVDELTDLRCGDLACGSGHILNESFDLLYDLYIYEGYSRGEAVENIFQRNLTGIDIDQRAMQLATFALLLKACQKDSTFTDAHVLPNVMSMPVVNEYSWKDLSWHFINNVQDMKPLPRGANEEITQCFHLMRDTQTLGSIVKFDISETTRQWMQQAIDAYYAHPCFEKNFEPLVTDLKIILALTDKYDALVMNPPYMGSGNMNKVLSDYVKKNYVEGKADLATSFVQMMPQHLVPNGKYAFIIPPSWMFLSNFESLRKDIIENNSIDSLLHLSRGVFGADFGSASSVITNAQPKATTSGTYFRLVERTFQEFNQDHLRILFEKTLADHSFKYKFKDYDKSNTEFPCSEDGNNIYYPNVEQSQFAKIPGCPIGYWCSQKIFSGFAGNLALSAVARPCVGLQTADNARFLRYWTEIDVRKSSCFSINQVERSSKKWIPTTKGGGFRKWYGNMFYVVNWENDGEELRNFKGSVIRNPNLYFKKDGCTWSTIASGKPSFRYFNHNWLFETKGSVCFPHSEDNNDMIMGYLNSEVVIEFLKVLSPTLDYHEGPMGKVPFKNVENKVEIDKIVTQNISISKQDWDAHETSWDFQGNELVCMDAEKFTSIYEQHYHKEELAEGLTDNMFITLEDRVKAFETEWTDKFMQLHDNEEELNRQFIDIYGLQDELTSDVPLDEVTILQQGEISIEK